MPDARISIVVPALNEEKLIGNLLSIFDDDIKKQFYIELIISDGGSSDSTVQIAQKYADRILIHKENWKQNISGGRNSGASIANGDVLIFLNADTFIKDISSFLSGILKIFQDADVIAIACPVKVFENEEILSDRLFHSFYNTYVKLLNKCCVGMGRGECHIVRKSFFEKEGRYDEKLYAGEDFDLYKRLKKHGKIHFASNLVVYESPRRYRKFGYAKVFWDWAKNSVWITLFGKSISQEWTQVR
ncbi:glycosyltransferase [bacterium]|nr:MAG: glycosyltransferase [bacterium]